MTTRHHVCAMSAAYAVAAAAVIGLLAGCASPRSSFESARAQGTREAYAGFLREYPNSEFSQQARDGIAEIDYQSALKAGTVERYRSHLATYPRGKNADDIRARLGAMESDEFDRAKEAETPQMWETFMRRWPASSRIAEARRLSDDSKVKQAFSTARQEGTLQAIDRFLVKWPRSRFAQEAEALAETLSFDAIQKQATVALCRAHLARFRQGVHAAEVARILKPLEATERIASALSTQVRGDLSSAIQDYPGSPEAGAMRERLVRRNQEVLAQGHAALGGQLDRLEAGPVFLESCAWAKVARHQAFGGEYLGLVASVPRDSTLMRLDRTNTFVEYADGTTGSRWIVWFPDWVSSEAVMSLNGTSLSAEIEMPGFPKGESWGRHGGMIALGYGSMLFHGGLMDVKWNMAYANFGRSDGVLDLDAARSPSTRRFVLLFPKSASKVRRLSIAGAEFRIGP